MHQLGEWLNYLGVSMAALFGTFAIPIIAALAILAVNRTLRGLLLGPEPRIPLPRSGVEIGIRAVNALLWIIAGLLILNAWGVGVSGLWTVMVSIVTAVGVGFLAVWTMVSNVTASLFITIWHPFHLGETVEILPEGLRGTVTGRNLMFTIVHEHEGTTLHVPNNFFFQKMFRIGTVSTPAGRADSAECPSAARARHEGGADVAVIDVV